MWRKSGVWSPGQQQSPPERDNNHQQRQEQQQQPSSISSGTQPPIWIPSSQQPSPKSERKEFRPVRLEALKKQAAAQQQPQQVFKNSRTAIHHPSTHTHTHIHMHATSAHTHKTQKHLQQEDEWNWTDDDDDESPPPLSYFWLRCCKPWPAKCWFVVSDYCLTLLERVTHGSNPNQCHRRSEREARNH